MMVMRSLSMIPEGERKYMPRVKSVSLLSLWGAGTLSGQVDEEVDSEEELEQMAQDDPPEFSDEDSDNQPEREPDQERPEVQVAAVHHVIRIAKTALPCAILRESVYRVAGSGSADFAFELLHSAASGIMSLYCLTEVRGGAVVMPLRLASDKGLAVQVLTGSMGFCLSHAGRTILGKAVHDASLPSRRLMMRDVPRLLISAAAVFAPGWQPLATRAWRTAACQFYVGDVTSFILLAGGMLRRRPGKARRLAGHLLLACYLCVQGLIVRALALRLRGSAPTLKPTAHKLCVGGAAAAYLSCTAVTLRELW